MKTVQTNVRVAETEKPLIVAAAARLRMDPSFRDKLVALLDERLSPELEDRIKKLEQQVSWLLSGAIVVPRATTPAIGARVAPRPSPPGVASARVTSSRRD